MNSIDNFATKPSLRELILTLTAKVDIIEENAEKRSNLYEYEGKTYDKTELQKLAKKHKYGGSLTRFINEMPYSSAMALVVS